MDSINIERGSLWVQALRSDKYTQARGQFIGPVDHTSDGTKPVIGYCCLAVATDVAIRNGCTDVRWAKQKDDDGAPRILHRQPDGDSYKPEAYGQHEVDPDGTVWVSYTQGDMPPEVAQWYAIATEGSNRENPMLNGHTAIARNDDLAEVFEDIADAIEADMARMGDV